MKDFWKDMGIAFVLGFLVPSILLMAVSSITGERQENLTITEPIFTIDITVPDDSVLKQPEISILDENGQIIQMALNDYLTGVVLAEMPVSFENEALKAQSVVARTYALRAANGKSKHPDVAVCTNASCCQAYVNLSDYLAKGGSEESVKRIRKIVDATTGQVLTYEGTLIEATYFSCSGGVTEDALAVWGTDVPYLQSVASPGEEDAAHYTDTVTFTVEEFASKLGLDLAGDQQLQISDVTYTNGGGIETMTIGEESFTGTQLRKLLNLYSTAFTVAIQDELVSIITRGFGHRVGMSQYGADAMAASGRTYEQILSYYYQGTELTLYED